MHAFSTLHVMLQAQFGASSYSFKAMQNLIGLIAPIYSLNVLNPPFQVQNTREWHEVAGYITFPPNAMPWINP